VVDWYTFWLALFLGASGLIIWNLMRAHPFWAVRLGQRKGTRIASRRAGEMATGARWWTRAGRTRALVPQALDTSRVQMMAAHSERNRVLRDVAWWLFWEGGLHPRDARRIAGLAPFVPS
jgi:hypothetical protein